MLRAIAQDDKKGGNYSNYGTLYSIQERRRFFYFWSRWCVIGAIVAKDPTEALSKGYWEKMK